MAIRELALLLVSVGTEPASGVSQPLRTPPLPPGVICGPMRTLELADMLLTAETTYAQVVAAWGDPRRAGPAGEVALYYLTCDARLWLSFEPSAPRRLRRAVLLTGSFVPTRTVILDELEVTRRRRCEQLPLGRRISATRVTEAWGPPDNEVGSGLVRWTYAMSDGRLGQVYPHGRSVSVGCGPDR